MKRALAELMVLLIVLGLVACNSPAPTPAPTAVPPTAAPTAAPPTAIPPTPTPAGPAAGETRVLDGSGVTLVYVPAGAFAMGSTEAQLDAAFKSCPKDRPFPRFIFESESPRQQVTLEGYWIGRTEVTNAQYQRFIDAGGYSTKSYWSDAGWTWKTDKAVTQPEYWSDPALNGADYPVVGVSWYEAEAFSRWAGGRLPTEAEWEKAARGTDGSAFPWGNEWDGARLNYCDSGCEYDWKDSTVNDQFATTAPVGTYPRGASPYGALDMAGNVYEWVVDWYKAYAGSPYQNDAYGEKYRVMRGGSWSSFEAILRCAARNGEEPGIRSMLTGFRVVQ